VQAACREGIRRSFLNSAHDCAEGGLAVALAECCISGGLGAEIQLGLAEASGERRWDEILFGESASRILVSVKPEAQGDWEVYLRECLGESAQHWQRLGTVKPLLEGLKISMNDHPPLINATIANMSDRFFNALERRL